MKYALIHINEPVLDGHRICQISNNTFEVYKDLTWHEVSDDVTAETHYWKNNQAVLFPVIENTQPTTSGTQEI
jgi:hypothetical protein